jgi:hypothetical protein
LGGILDPAKARAIYETGYTSVYLVSKAKPVAIMKALQRTMVVKRQYSEDVKELFLRSAAEKNYATLANAEMIVNEAKRIQRKRRKLCK